MQYFLSQTYAKLKQAESIPGVTVNWSRHILVRRDPAGIGESMFDFDSTESLVKFYTELCGMARYDQLINNYGDTVFVEQFKLMFCGAWLSIGGTNMGQTVGVYLEAHLPKPPVSVPAETNESNPKED